MKDLPRYRSHKEVNALKIVRATSAPNSAMHVALKFEGYDDIIVHGDVVKRYYPKAGDYLVIYEDGYQSISPAKAFEDGYTRVQ